MLVRRRPGLGQTPPAPPPSDGTGAKVAVGAAVVTGLGLLVAAFAGGSTKKKPLAGAPKSGCGCGR